MILETKQKIKRMTPYVIIQRQLWPQPPKDSEPYWCYINTLMFKNKDRNTVWEQEIPEANCGPFPMLNKYFNCELKHDKNFGWLLIAKISHQKAKKIMPIIYYRIFNKNV